MAIICPSCSSKNVATANSLEEYADKPDTDVICGDCGWMGETDDLSAD